MSSGGHNISLRTWLRKMPQPVAVLADDKRIEVPRSGRPWHELEASILTLAPNKIVLLDAAGATLRAKALSDLVRVEYEDDKAEISDTGTDLRVLAKLLAEAYEKSGRQYEPLLKSAMDMVAHQSARITQMEREIDKWRNQCVKLQAEILRLSAQPAGDEEPNILGALAQGFLAAQGEQQQDTPAPVPIKRGVK